METLIKVLIIWISGVTGLPATDRMPQVTFRPPSAIEQLVAGQNGPAHNGNLSVAVAFYDPRRHEVVLPLGWRADNPFHLSMLVHELVHHMQAEAGLSYECPGARERVAYAAQQSWLESQRLDLFENDEFEVDRLFHLVVTSCLF